LAAAKRMEARSNNLKYDRCIFFSRSGFVL
jgi:hypothetical protein